MATEQSSEIVLPNQDADRFWRKVCKTDACWLREGAGSGNGSGYFKLNGKRVKASHLAWQIANREFPPAGDSIYIDKIKQDVANRVRR